MRRNNTTVTGGFDREKNKIETEKNRESYNGWANYETWNVALWILNDRSLYSLAQGLTTYTQFINAMPYDCYMTPDQVSFRNPLLDIKALNELISELE